jgi:hypothetical protein
MGPGLRFTLPALMMDFCMKDNEEKDELIANNG